MTASAELKPPDPSPEPPQPPLPARRWPWVVAVLALALAFIEPPQAAEPGLDPSWHLALVHAHRAGLQFGPDVAFNCGPLWFVTSPETIDGVPALMLAWKTAGALALAATFVALGAGLTPVRRFLFLLALLAAPLLSWDALRASCSTLVVVAWLLPRGARRWQATLAVCWLAFFSQVKLTHLVQAGAGLLVVVAALTARGERRRAAGVAGGFAGAFLALWLVAGQSLVNLPTYAVAAGHIVLGYSAAMGLNDVRWPVWVAGLVLWALAAFAAGGALQRGGDRATLWPTLAYLGVAWSVSWRHGFVRASEGHALHTLTYALLVPLAVRLEVGPRRPGALDLCPVVALLGIALLTPGHVLRLPARAAERVAHVAAGPGAWARRLAEDERRRRDEGARPDLRAAVGTGSIDALGYEQDVLLVNGLAYTPRPLLQGYIACTPWLMRHDLAFFRSARAPEFVLARLQSIDGRYPAQDDALILAELRRRYDVTLTTDRDALLRRKPAPPASLEQSRTLLVERTVRLGEELVLPADRRAALWLQADLSTTFAGRVRGLVTFPEPLELLLTDDAGREHSFRLVAATAAEGFVIQPLLASQADLNVFLRGGGGRWVRSLRLRPPERAYGSWADDVPMRVFRLEECPLVP